MPETTDRNKAILKLLEEKSSTKQKVFRKSKIVLDELKEELKKIAGSLSDSITAIDENVVVEYRDKGTYEAEIKFSGDILLFNMHTNAFTFEKDHPLWKSGYIREDKRRAYFGMINIYNFLADSFRFNRVNDVGVLLGRIFVNCEGHFFVEGKRQLGFLYNDLPNHTVSAQQLRDIIEMAMIFALEYDLTVPDFKDVMLVSVNEVLTLSNELHLKTSKKLGFRFHTRMQQLE